MRESYYPQERLEREFARYLIDYRFRERVRHAAHHNIPRMRKATKRPLIETTNATSIALLTFTTRATDI